MFPASYLTVCPITLQKSLADVWSGLVTCAEKRFALWVLACVRGSVCAHDSLHSKQILFRKFMG